MLLSATRNIGENSNLFMMEVHHISKIQYCLNIENNEIQQIHFYILYIKLFR
jgi:hypothetical protein